jgi:hypothetical protein
MKWSKTTIAFWIFWGFDALVSAAILYFFVAGLTSGMVGSFNIGIWLTMVFAASLIMVASWKLKAKGHPWIGMGILALMLIPGLLAVLYLLFVAVIVTSAAMP